jgi:hypothetical protein
MLLLPARTSVPAAGMPGPGRGKPWSGCLLAAQICGEAPVAPAGMHIVLASPGCDGRLAALVHERCAAARLPKAWSNALQKILSAACLIGWRARGAAGASSGAAPLCLRDARHPRGAPPLLGNSHSRQHNPSFARRSTAKAYSSRRTIVGTIDGAIRVTARPARCPWVQTANGCGKAPS